MKIISLQSLSFLASFGFPSMHWLYIPHSIQSLLIIFNNRSKNFIQIKVSLVSSFFSLIKCPDQKTIDTWKALPWQLHLQSQPITLSGSAQSLPYVLCKCLVRQIPRRCSADHSQYYETQIIHVHLRTL